MDDPYILKNMFLKVKFFISIILAPSNQIFFLSSKIIEIFTLLLLGDSPTLYLCTYVILLLL